MLSIDSLILQFIDGNFLTISAAYAVLYGLAKYSPWKWDEKVMEILGGALEFFQYKKK